MSIKLGVVMDPIGSITTYKDTTLAMLLEAQRRGWDIHYMEQADLFQRDGESLAHMRRLRVYDDSAHWFDLEQPHTQPLTSLDAVLMRKDPPFDMEYVFSTYLLELAESKGVLVVNKPQGLRDANEKMFTTWFPQCIPPTLVTRCRAQIREFLDEQGDIIVKPLDSMGGASVFRLREDDPNIGVVLETVTGYDSRSVMVQRYVPEIVDGDKRILLIDGEPVPYALARIAPAGETRANLAVGGKGHGVELSERDQWICEQVRDRLRDRGLMFVGLDVIGDFLTEINVTSPTCVRELDKIYDINISAQLMDCIAARLQAS
ncbi:MAG: glutathione synthase [Gammaproteobacteria bacterium]|nr:MAG: glutathione synthase [Gammaproteobacteria bacterium]